MQATAQRSTIKVPSRTGLRLKAPGTCGELMQGAIDEQDFLVNCPVNLFSYATVQKGDDGLHLHDLHRYTNRLWAWRSEFGNDRYWAAELGSTVLSGSAASPWHLLTNRMTA